MLSCSLAGGDASRGTQICLSSCSIPLKPIRDLKTDPARHPLLVFGFSDDMATDRNNGANGRGAIRLSRQSNAKPVIENVDQFAKNVAAVYGALDSKEFINATFRLLQAAAPGCFAWMMVRYSDSRGAVCMSSNGLRLEDEMIAKRFYHDYPGYRFLMEHPGIKILPAKNILPESEELPMSDFYWLCMLPMGWRHALGLCFWEERSFDGLDCIFWIHRTSALGDFTAAEIRLLENLYPLIDDARRRSRYSFRPNDLRCTALRSWFAIFHWPRQFSIGIYAPFFTTKRAASNVLAGDWERLKPNAPISTCHTT